MKLSRLLHRTAPKPPPPAGRYYKVLEDGHVVAVLQLAGGDPRTLLRRRSRYTLAPCDKNSYDWHQATMGNASALLFR